MAGEWIKMRTSLMTSPKVNGIARHLEMSREACRTLSTGYNGTLSDIVTRNVTRCITVASLLVIWGAANEHTKDGVFRNADLSDIDDMVGLPGFGEAMEAVGWAIYDEDADCVILPNFIEYNTVGEDRKSSSAERQRRYRERKKAQQSDVTRYVTSNGREEKRREEKINKNTLYAEEKNSSVDNFSQPSETPDPAANNFVMNNRPPSAGGIGAFGKFVMTPDWKPDPDILKQAALWGVSLDSEITQQELAQFVSYWLAEGKAYHHTQWQQKLVQSVKTVRTKSARPERRDIMAMSEPDTEIPPGFRG
nr:MAG TPA: Primosomal protein 1 [Caudoviricetes sp.]